LLPGVARKTANIILGNAFGIVEGIAVDTHVNRLSQRLRLVDMSGVGGKKEISFHKNGTEVVDYKKDADAVKIEYQLMHLIPKAEWFRFTYRIIDHGRALCKAQNPDCSRCMLKKHCPVARI
jgi:endonuclease III